MQAAVFYQPDDVRIEERPTPTAAAGQVRVDPFFTHRLGVARTEAAMALHGSGDAIKILIDPNA